MRNKPLALFFPFDLLSHYLRCLELADSIRDDHSVLFAGSSKYNSYIKERGYKVFECENYDAVEMVRCASKFDFSWINERNIERIFLSQLKCIEELKPDVVIGDGVNTLKMAAEASGAKYISLMNGYMTKHYRLVRDVPSGHPAAKYSQHLPPKIYAAIIRFAESLAFRQVHRPFKAIRKRHKLKKLSTFPDEMEGDLNIILDLPEVFPQRELPSNYIHAGPVFYTGCSTDVDCSILDEKPCVLVSMGSSGSWENISYLNDPCFGDYNIIAAGDHMRTLNAPHITHFSFVSGIALWSRILLVICHGGNGTVYQALSKGIPVLCRPDFFEQEYNARRVEEMGFGACINTITCAGQLKEIIDHWIPVARSGILNRVTGKINVNETKRKFSEALRLRYRTFGLFPVHD